MILIIAFAITVLVGDLVAVGVCAIIEPFSDQISLLLFLAMFMAVIPLAWRIAVQATEPSGLLMRYWK